MDNSQTVKDVLLNAKSHETPSQSTVLLNNKEACSMVSSWPSVDVYVDYNTKINPKQDMWTSIWEMTSYSLSEWAASSGVPLLYAGKVARIVIGNRLIYPDGTLNKYAERYVATKVINSMALKVPLQPKEPKKEKPETKPSKKKK